MLILSLFFYLYLKRTIWGTVWIYIVVLNNTRSFCALLAGRYRHHSMVSHPPLRSLELPLRMTTEDWRLILDLFLVLRPS